MSGYVIISSSIAIFVEDQLRISAIYDPLHHQVYSGHLPGPPAAPETYAKSSVWDISSGSCEDLIEKFNKFSHQNAKKSLAVHLPRSNVNKRNDFLLPRNSDKVLLNELASSVDTVYALNSGLLALAQIANCSLDGFANIITNSWDVAAGEVILRACGGKITDFNGHDLTYTDSNKISLLAANSPDLHKKLLETIKTVLPKAEF